jgi:flagellar basal-body rod modification protein FlgD
MMERCGYEQSLSPTDMSSEAAMTIAPVQGTGATTNTKSPKTVGSSALDKDSFLKLLVATMRYQDPSSPMDTSQIMSQSAQMSSVESLQQMQQATAQTLSFQGMLLSSSLVGKTITAAGTDGSVVTGRVTAARTVSGASYVLVNDVNVPVASVFEVR